MELNDLSIKNIKLNPGDKIHFIGIGGSSMSGLAELSLKNGYVISGSDRSATDITEKLVGMGITVSVGHNADNITSDISLVVYTVAVGNDNPEYLRAQELGIPVVERGIFLGFIANHFKKTIAVAGVHGKTTTTSMIASILMSSDKNPSIHLGGVLPFANSNVIFGSHDLFLTEACEYHNNFLHVKADIGVLLNLEPEHLDFFKSYDNMKNSFTKYASGINKDGVLIVCADSADALACAANAVCGVITYSVSEKVSPFAGARHHYYAEIHDNADTSVLEGGYSFTYYCDGEKIDTISLLVPGLHNVSNALAAIAAARETDCSVSGINEGFAYFKGTKRRFDFAGTCNGAYVINDYAHHPTEIKATIEAARSRTDKKVIAVFQPHTFSRVISLREKFPEALSGADHIIVTDIYAAREKDEHIVSGLSLSEDCKAAGLNAEYIGPFEKIAARIKEISSRGDVVLLLGAGTIILLSPMITE